MPSHSRSRSPRGRSRSPVRRRSRSPYREPLKRHSRSRSRSRSCTPEKRIHDRRGSSRSLSRERIDSSYKKSRARSADRDSLSPSRSRQRKESKSPKRKKSRRDRSSSSSEREERRTKSKKSKKTKTKKSSGSNEGKKKKKSGKKELELFGYSDETNPFGDTNLGEKFVWKKKMDKLINEGVDPSDLKGQERKRRKRLMLELQKAKERREQREMEKEQWEEEQRRLDRIREGEKYADWEKQEMQFHLEQAKLRAKIRINEERAKPIDILYKNLSQELDFDFDVREPVAIFEGLELSDLKDLRQDILMYLDLDDNPNHREFWDSMLIVADDRLSKAEDAMSKTLSSTGAILSKDDKQGLHNAVLEDVIKTLIGKSSKELDEMKINVLAMLRGGEAVDVEYWESLLAKLKVARATARLKEIHRELLQIKLAKLKQEAARETEMQRLEREKAAQRTKALEYTRAEEESKDEANVVEGRKQEKEEVAQLGISEDDKKIEEQLISEGLSKEDAALIIAQKKAFMEKRKSSAPQKEEDEAQGNVAEPGYDEDLEEEVFTGEIALPEKVYSWRDKYRPRKPRFFNRIKSGYEWNLYNRTHYDHDNPPPRSVLGYKFNIFYPDLIDKTKAPTYYIEKNPDDPNDDTCILRFHAGPPYEDIAFKIVNREWNLAGRRGFKCVFDRDALQLWFTFKRYRYRR